METGIPAATGFYSKADVREKLGGLHDSTLWRMSQRGEFPKPVRITTRRVGYRREEVDAWIAARNEQPKEPEQFARMHGRGGANAQAA